MGTGTGLWAGEHIHVAMEPSKRVNTLATPTYIFWPIILCSGMLTGKFKRDETPTDPTSSRVAWVEADPSKRSFQSSPSFSQYKDDERYWSLIDTMKEIAQKHSWVNHLSWYSLYPYSLHYTDATVAQIAIAWLLAQPTVTSVVLGARTKAQLADNLASIKVELTNEEVSYYRSITLDSTSIFISLR